MVEVGFHAMSAGRDLLSFGRGRPRVEGVAVTDLLNFVALSLLPPRWWRTAAGRLRAGSTAEAALDDTLAAHDHGKPGRASGLRSRAARALQAARASRITAVSWNDPDYPVALAAIPDPPFVLWMRGRVATLNAPAVAIVGARAASP